MGGRDPDVLHGLRDQPVHSQDLLQLLQRGLDSCEQLDFTRSPAPTGIISWRFEAHGSSKMMCVFLACGHEEGACDILTYIGRYLNIDNCSWRGALIPREYTLQLEGESHPSVPPQSKQMPASFARTPRARGGRRDHPLRLEDYRMWSLLCSPRWGRCCVKRPAPLPPRAPAPPP